MSLDRAVKEALLRALATAMIEHADELTGLDQAIGDGDHGLNMKRGFEALLATLPGVADKSLPEMLKAVGTTLVMKIGGASGPLYGTLMMTLGKAIDAAPDAAGVARARRLVAVGVIVTVLLVPIGASRIPWTQPSGPRMPIAAVR